MYLNKDNLDKIIILLIQCAHDDDIGQFLKNCSEELLDLKTGKVNHNPYDMMSYKEILIYYLCIINFDFKESLCGLDTSIIEKNINKNKYKIELIMYHLKAIAACYYSYNIFFLEEYLKKENIGKNLYKKYIKKFKDMGYDLGKSLNIQGLKREDIAEILHIIIHGYKKNKFYYETNFKEINKIIIDYNPVTKSIDLDQKKYLLVNSSREPHLVECQTGEEIPIGRKLKEPFTKEVKLKKIVSSSLDYFKGTNERITEALVYEKEPCCWCNPNKFLKNPRKKCNNCKNLLEALNEIKKDLKDKELKKIDFNDKIRKTTVYAEEYFDDDFNYLELNKDSCISQLRFKRAVVLYNFLKKAKNQQNAKLINEAKKLIDKSFKMNSNKKTILIKIANSLFS